MKGKTVLLILLGLGLSFNALAAPFSWEALLNESETTYVRSLLLEDSLSFDYWFETSAEPGSYSGQAYDVVVLQTPGDWAYLGQVSAYYSHTEWQMAELTVPVSLRGEEREVRFLLRDLGPDTGPQVYLNNVGGASAPVPEPATLLLLGSGLLGLAGMRQKKR